MGEIPLKRGRFIIEFDLVKRRFERLFDSLRRGYCRALGECVVIEKRVKCDLVVKRLS